MTARSKLTSALALVTVLAAAAPAAASNAWSNWHWQRAQNPVTLPVLNSTTDNRTPVGGQNWPAALAKAASDWTQSTVLDLAVAPQSPADLAAQQACPFQPGAIRVCNVVNPDVTWLGLATVLPSDTGGSGHILAATAQMNDSWFSTPLYGATAAQQVMCQEVGHTFGLDHQDTSGKDLNTCMDYSNALDNPSPDAHDYSELTTIYSHLDASGASTPPARGGKNPKGATAATGGWTPEAIGKPSDYHGSGPHGRLHSNVYTTRENGQTVIRYVLWAY